MIHAACWANPEYAILVAKIMRQYHAKAVRKAALAKEMLLEEKLDRKRNKIDSLDRLLVESKQARKEARAESKQARKEREEARAESKQARAEAKQDRKDRKKTTEQLNDLKERTDRVLDAIGFVQDQNADLLEQNDGLERHLVTIKRTLKTVSKDRVMPTSKRIDYPVLAIALNGSVFIDPNGDSEDSEDSVPPYDISAIRAANGNVAQQLKYIQKKYPEAKIWKRTDDPNSMISWKYYIEKYGHNITRKGRECSLNPGYTMKQFWIDLEDCSDAKMQDCE
jgi:archaellum component FlaC